MDARILAYLFVLSSSDHSNRQQQQQPQAKRTTTEKVDEDDNNQVSKHIQLVRRNWIYFASRVLTTIIIGIIGFFVLYFVIASPPMHWFYDISPPAGPNTVYVPGGGFSGFWFHLGYFNSLGSDIQNYDYYCFSSGCLGILASLMNHTVEDVANIGFDAQKAWTHGNISRYDLIDYFVDNLMENKIRNDNDDHQRYHLHEDILPRLKILVTTTKNGYEAKSATNLKELKDLLAKTTWVPYLTAWGFLSDNTDTYLDGGFSRMLHPECEYSLHLPIIWDTLIHTFNPGLSLDQVVQLSEAGSRYDFGLPRYIR